MAFSKIESIQTHKKEAKQSNKSYVAASILSMIQRIWRQDKTYLYAKDDEEKNIFKKYNTINMHTKILEFFQVEMKKKN
jgi:hypothetical protein